MSDNYTTITPPKICANCRHFLPAGAEHYVDVVTGNVKATGLPTCAAIERKNTDDVGRHYYCEAVRNMADCGPAAFLYQPKEQAQ